ncbi:hypothetical protein vBLivaVAfA18_086 [Listeria phage vB_Liva_VAfA18]|uniref:Phage terminase large subunit GpA ATPase domain-containing protein n=1 Tax=Listeria phage vB_Liva_VAfA18 TaxID=2712945 RepID=A0A858EAC8_9CAUD|nr:hypothetical protein vBLivaVAfA18_086 [Listeria phage vB_Liva_VAfA18]
MSGNRGYNVSEMGVGSMIHFADTHSYAAVKCLYTFPTGEQMRKFVQSRLDPVLESSYYSSILDKDNNSLNYKRIRNSHLYFRTSSKPGAVEGVDIDYLSMDEYDRVPVFSEASALESMASSPFKIVRRWSTPSAPGMGIHRLFENSDQHWYLHKCEKCNHWNQLDYEDYDSSSVEAGGNILCVNPQGVDTLAKTVVEGSFQFVCKKCGAPLDRWYNGEWVAKHPDRTKNGDGIRGYMISQMNAVWISADDLKRKELNSLSKQAFFNYTLGYPFEDAKLAVYSEDIIENPSPRVKVPMHSRGDYKYISVGIDWGNTHWVSVHGMTERGEIDLIRLFSVEKSRGVGNIESDLDKIILEVSMYNPDMIVADVGDSGNYVDKLVKHFGEDRVFGCIYKSSPKSTGQLKPQWNESGNVVTVDKLMQNKRYIIEMKTKKVNFYSFIDPMLKLLVDHWRNVVIQDEEDEKDGTFYQVIGRRGDDHLAQASVYSFIGLDRLADMYLRGSKYEFNSTFVTSNYQDVSSTPPDIFSKY